MIVAKTPIVDVVGLIVDKVSQRLTSQLQEIDALITGVHYQHGHPLEIIETMNQFDKSDTFVYEKYPLVALFQDFEEDKATIGTAGEVRLNLIIARATLADYKAAERYTQNFKPILYPIYQALLEEIGGSFAGKYFSVKDTTQISHTKIDRLYWGRNGLYKNEKNVFNDKIDAIEIKDLVLSVNSKFC